MRDELLLLVECSFATKRNDLVRVGVAGVYWSYLRKTALVHIACCIVLGQRILVSRLIYRAVQLKFAEIGRLQLYRLLVDPALLLIELV